MIYKKLYFALSLNTGKDDSIMENKQKINCTVTSCKYNENNEHECSLKQIVVTPMPNCETAKPDESMCSSYKNRE